MKRFPSRLGLRWGIASILTVSIVSVIVLLTALTTVLDIRRLRATFLDSLQERGLLMATTLNDVMADPLYFQDIDRLNDIAEVVRGQPDVVYVQVFGPSGRLLVGPFEHEYATGFIGDGLGLAAIQSRGTLLEFKDGVLDVASPVEVGQEVIGGVQLGFDGAPVEAEIQALTLRRIWQSLGLIAFGVLLSVFLAQYFIRPIRRLVKATEQVSEGEFETSAINPRNDEIGELSRAFAVMVERLHTSRARSEAYAAELGTSNEQLMREIGERKQTEQELRQAKEAEGSRAEELETTLKQLWAAQEQLVQSEKLAAIGTLVSGVAHEVNNPLTGVLGRVDLLLREEPEEVLRGDLKVIQHETKRAVRTVQNLLSFAREHKAEKSYMSINEALESILDLRAYHLRVNNIELHTDLHPDVPWTMADPHQLQQVFLNLINNAEQAMGEARGQGALSVATRHIDNNICVTFQDDGPGIPEHMLTQVFDPFFTTKPVGKGTGLGLSICFGIIREHGGEIRVASQLGKGTTFTVELPVIAESNAEP